VKVEGKLIDLVASVTTVVFHLSPDTALCLNVRTSPHAWETLFAKQPATILLQRSSEETFVLYTANPGKARRRGDGRIECSYIVAAKSDHTAHLALRAECAAGTLSVVELRVAGDRCGQRVMDVQASCTVPGVSDPVIEKARRPSYLRVIK
jgi:hypothetical protein